MHGRMHEPMHAPGKRIFHVLAYVPGEVCEHALRSKKQESVTWKKKKKRRSWADESESQIKPPLCFDPGNWD